MLTQLDDISALSLQMQSQSYKFVFGDAILYMYLAETYWMPLKYIFVQ